MAKPTLRTKSLTTKLTQEEYASLERLARLAQTFLPKVCHPRPTARESS
jgi:hypothetical protein